MDDAMAHKMFGFIFGVCGVLAIATSVMVRIFASQAGFADPLVWMTGVLGIAALLGGIGLYRQNAWARRAMILEAVLVLGGAVIGALANLGAEPMKGIVLLTGIMPAVAVIAMLIQLERSARQPGSA